MTKRMNHNSKKGAGKREWHLAGFITERDFNESEKVFPGIKDAYRRAKPKPKTFLELEWFYFRALPKLDSISQKSHLRRH